MNFEKNIKAKGSIYIDDYIDKSMKIGVHLFMIILIVMSVISIDLLTYLFTDASESISESLKKYWIIVLIIIIFEELLLHKFILFKLKKPLKNSNLKKEHIYVINNEGISRYIGEKCLFIAWDNINNIIETNNAFKIKVIYKGKIKSSIPKELINNKNIKNEFDSFELSNPFLIPKHFFETEDDITYFKEILDGNIKINRIQF